MSELICLLKYATVITRRQEKKIYTLVCSILSFKRLFCIRIFRVFFSNSRERIQVQHVKDV